MIEWPLKEIMRSITDKGFLSIKKLRDYAFPEANAEYQKITQKKWVRICAWLCPFVTLVSVVVFMLYPITMGYCIGLDTFSYFFLILFHLLASIEALFCLVVLLAFALIIKLRKRNPAILLAITPVFFLKRLPVFCVIYLFLAIFYKGLLSDQGKYRQVRMAIEETIGKGTVIDEPFWGFVPGLHSFSDVVEILKLAGAEYEVTGYRESSDLPIINIKSYKAFEHFGRLRSAELHFDGDKRLYSIDLEGPNEWSFSMSEPHLTDQERHAFVHLKEYFHSQYHTLMQKAGCVNDKGIFYTPWAVKITVSKHRVNLAFILREKRYLEAKKRVEMTQGKKYKYLIHSTFSPQESQGVSNGTIANNRIKAPIK